MMLFPTQKQPDGQRTCPHCIAAFAPKNGQHIYCTTKCLGAARRIRRRGQIGYIRMPIDYNAGQKFCKCCDKWLSLDSYHRRVRKGRPSTQPYCMNCMRQRWHAWNWKARGGPKPAPVAYTPSDPLSCMGTVGGFLRGSL